MTFLVPWRVLAQQLGSLKDEDQDRGQQVWAQFLGLMVKSASHVVPPFRSLSTLWAVFFLVFERGKGSSCQTKAPHVQLAIGNAIEIARFFSAGER